MKKYITIPAWVFQWCADWKELPSARSGVETRSFFENHSGYSNVVYIMEEPDSPIEKYNQGYLSELEAIAKDFEATIITWDTPEAQAFYVARVNQSAEKFEVAGRPFVAFAQSIGR